MKNVFSLDQVAAVLGINVEDVEELLVDIKAVKNADSLTVCDENGYVMETFVRLPTHVETDLLVTKEGFRALVKEVYYAG